MINKVIKMSSIYLFKASWDVVLENTYSNTKYNKIESNILDPIWLRTRNRVVDKQKRRSSQIVIS